MRAIQEDCCNSLDTITLLELVAQTSWHKIQYEVSPAQPTTLVKVLHAEAAGVFDEALDLLVLLHHFVVGVVDIYHVGHKAEEHRRSTVDTCTGNKRTAGLTALHLELLLFPSFKQTPDFIQQRIAQSIYKKMMERAIGLNG